MRCHHSRTLTRDTLGTRYPRVAIVTREYIPYGRLQTIQVGLW
jgi:hypothetical protein